MLKLKDHFPGVPVMALSATATLDALTSLKESMLDPFILRSSVNRSNIYLESHEIKSFGHSSKG